MDQILIVMLVTLFFITASLLQNLAKWAPLQLIKNGSDLALKMTDRLHVRADNTF